MPSLFYGEWVGKQEGEYRHKSGKRLHNEKCRKNRKIVI